jgi:hypothetical protein
MGEVTNTFVTIRNRGNGQLDNVCATLSASDEGRPHPDKTACLPTLPAGYQVSFKLTVDTTFKQDTLIKVDVIAQEGAIASQQTSACRELTIPGDIPSLLGSPEPIH